uniref:Carbonic anhydrase n=1 Tax=Trichuris muris TaxID=70415 RepID=A0A5S6QKK0_TRIMR
MELIHLPSTLVILLPCIILSNVALALEWDYESMRAGPSNWSRVASPLCDGKKQSPIAIWLNDLTLLLVPTDIPYLRFENLNASIGEVKIENNGHSVQVTIPESVNVTLKGGPLQYTYRLAQFHFHWATVDNLGSEHTIGDTHYPLEAHFVHIYEEARENSSVTRQFIAVVGVLFKLAPSTFKEQTPLAPFAEYVKTLAYKGNRHILNFTIDVSSFYPTRRNSYVSYLGSLTTPPCSENVQWIVFTDPMPITRTELDSFRNLHSSRSHEAEKWLQFNYRPTQPLYNREVHWVQEAKYAHTARIYSCYLADRLVVLSSLG